MAINILQEKKRQRYMMVILALVIIAILIIIWQGILKKEEAPPSPLVQPLIPQKVIIDWPTLKNTQITNLRAFEPIPPFEGEIGRKNPFAPY